MNNIKPRLLKASEISCRVQSLTKNNGVIILLYKDARTDMAILDETFGMMNWQRTHREINGKMFCGIDVWDADKKQWVTKEDVGVESNTEATKGEASDAFKRSGTNWGIGRELYTAPFVFVQLAGDEVYEGNNGKPQVSPRFGLSVTEIGYNADDEIDRLVLTDKKGNVRFEHGKRGGKSNVTPLPITPPMPTEEEKRELKLTRMKLIAQDVSKYIGSKDKDKVREGIAAVEMFMRVNKTYDGIPYENLSPEQFADYLLNLNAYYQMAEDKTEETA